MALINPTASKLTFPEFCEMMGNTINYYDLEFSLGKGLSHDHYPLLSMDHSLLFEPNQPCPSNQSRKESAFRAFDTESKGHIDAKDLLNSLRFTQVDEAEAQEFIK